MIRATIFDLDGTLVDSLPGIAAALNRVLAAHGLPVHSEEVVQSFVGNGSLMLVKRGIGGEPEDELVEEVHREFFPAYSETWRTGTHLYDGIRPLLEDLRAQGMPLAVCSNKPHRFTVEIMETMFDWIPWVMVLGQQEKFPRKPDSTGALMIAEKFGLAPAEIAFVGDSPVDFETGRAAEMQAVLVDWGFTPTEQLRARPAPLMSTPDDLRRFLLVLRPD